MTLNVIDEAACPANLGFDNQQTYDSGLGLNVRTADMDGDGILDLVVHTASSSKSIQILPGFGDGTFDDANPIILSAGGSARTPDFADFNEDNNADIILSTGTVLVYLGNGDGTFASAVGYGGELIAWGLAVADFNQDGIADLASGNFGNQEV